MRVGRPYYDLHRLKSANCHSVSSSLAQHLTDHLLRPQVNSGHVHSHKLTTNSIYSNIAINILIAQESIVPRTTGLISPMIPASILTNLDLTNPD